MANKFKLQKEVEEASGRLGITMIHKQKVKVIDFTVQFIKGKGKSNTKLFNQTLHHIEQFGGKEVAIQNINPLWAEDFKNYLLQHVNPTTAWNYFAKLKMLMKYAVRQQLIDRNPCDGISIRVQEAPPKFLTLDEVKKVGATPCSNLQVRNASVFAVMTGLRWSDIKNLEWSHISNGTVLITQQKVKRLAQFLCLSLLWNCWKFRKQLPLARCRGLPSTMIGRCWIA